VDYSGFLRSWPLPVNNSQRGCQSCLSVTHCDTATRAYETAKSPCREPGRGFSRGLTPYFSTLIGNLRRD
jgi:hypothetical protein